MGGWLLPAFGVLLRAQTVKRLVCFSFDKNCFFFCLVRVLWRERRNVLVFVIGRVWVLGVAKDNSVSVVLLAGGKGKRMGVSCSSLTDAIQFFHGASLFVVFMIFVCGCM